MLIWLIKCIGIRGNYKFWWSLKQNDIGRNYSTNFCIQMNNVPNNQFFWVNKVFFAFSQHVDNWDWYIRKSIIHINFTIGALILEFSLSFATLIFFKRRIWNTFSKYSENIFSNISIKGVDFILSKLFLSVWNMSIGNSIIQNIVRSISQSWANGFDSYFVLIPL